MRLIETDRFPFEFLSRLAERESWRKEVHRPVYHVHKWWAKRLGSVFRGILLGCLLPEEGCLEPAFYEPVQFPGVSVLDPFMGSGTTIGEAHKLGLTALGRDINPVAADAVRVALGPLDRGRLDEAFASLAEGVGAVIRDLYRSVDAQGRPCDILYHFWAMQATCPGCSDAVDLLPSWVIARNAYPAHKPEVQVLCPGCGGIFPAVNGQVLATCRSCGLTFDPTDGPARGAKAACRNCLTTFRILDALDATRTLPGYRLYGKLVLTQDGAREYLSATEADHAAYRDCSRQLRRMERQGAIALPDLMLEDGYNTRQAMGYGFRRWRDFFNDRQLLALGLLRAAIREIPGDAERDALLTLFSGVLEFNNRFASYKGEGTGAVRHMFAHHILKPERAPIEANVWGTPKSSGSFSGLYRRRLLKAIEYRLKPVEVAGNGRISAPSFTGRVEPEWPTGGAFGERAVYLSCGDSAHSGLPDGSVSLVVTDPPFFDNVHYSELADFFRAWQVIGKPEGGTTRNAAEVQDVDPDAFAAKLGRVFGECARVLDDDGLMVFTYHHSRDDGWRAVAQAVLQAGFVVVNCHPVKSEMSVGVPKAQAREPIQLDIVIVCRKRDRRVVSRIPDAATAVGVGLAKLQRLNEAGFRLSANDRKVVVYGQMLTTLRSPDDAAGFPMLVDAALAGADATDSAA